MADQLYRAERKGEWKQATLAPERMPDGLDSLPGDSPGGFFGTGTWHLAGSLKTALDDGDRSALSPAATFIDGWRQQRVLDAARTSAESNGAWRRV